MENLYLWVYKIQIHVDLFFDHYFNFLSAKTEINKRELNLINLDGLEALGRQICSTFGTVWIILRFMWFEEHLNCSLKLHCYILVLRLFCRISVISELSLLGIGLKTKPRIPRKIFIFQLFLLKLYQIHFCVWFSLFLLTEFVIPLFNCFFRDFPDFWVFNLAKLDAMQYLKWRFLLTNSRVFSYWGKVEGESPLAKNC